MVDTARALLVTGGVGSITLREVGRRMGMTASALYRYVDGHAALVDRLRASLYDELIEELQRVVPLRDPVDGPRSPDVVLDDLVAASTAFRRWCVQHPEEFALMFGREDPALADCHLAHEAGERFGQVFLRLFAQGVDAPLKDDAGTLFGALPPPLDEFFARAWVRLLGLVMVEVAGHHSYMALDPDRLFELEMTECGGEILQALATRQPAAGGH
jgi:AcrR family transcriptional regulator